MVSARHKNSARNLRQAKTLRQAGSIVEKLLLKALRQQMKSFEVKFRYQHPVDPYIVDFACLSARLVVEIDGMSHDSSANDDRRQKYIKHQGFYIQRFSNADVMKDATAVAAAMCEQACLLQKMRWKQTPPRTASPFDPPARGG